MDKKLVWLSGQDADAGQKMDDNGESTWRVEGGPHDGHTVTVRTAKHNCGAYATDIDCSCGAGWSSAMNGCWQWGHQRDEEGDPTLAEMDTMAYTYTGMPDEEDEASIPTVELGDIIAAKWPGEDGLIEFPITGIREDEHGTLCAVFGKDGVVGAEAIASLVIRDGVWMVANA